MFFVEYGVLKIRIEKNDYPLTDETTLQAGEWIVIQPKEYHSFEIMQEGTVAYEIYWTEIDSNDIERKNSGSI
jgi:D-lyxose ketol-isomerase